MRTSTKKWMKTGALLIGSGALLFAGVMTVNRWDFRKLNTVEYRTDTFAIQEDFADITVNTVNANIVLARAEDETCSVICHDNAHFRYSAVVSDGTLTVSATDQSTWDVYFGLDFDTPQITISLPDSKYERLTVESKTGDVALSDGFSFEGALIHTATGAVSLKDVTTKEEIRLDTVSGAVTFVGCDAPSICVETRTGNVRGEQLSDSTQRIVIRTATGNVSLKDVTVKEEIKLNTATGDVSFDRCDAPVIYVETTTGDVRGTLLSDSTIVTKTGDVSIEKLS